jgi:hypothetical protein
MTLSLKTDVNVNVIKSNKEAKMLEKRAGPDPDP